MQWPVKPVPHFLLAEDNPNLIAPCFDCCSILHNSTRWPDSHMALCHHFHSSVHLLWWWNENFAKPKQMSFKGLSASRIFHALNFWTSAISSCRSKQGYAYAWYRRSRRRKVLIKPKNSGRQWMDRLSLLMLACFLPKRAKLFLCPSDAPSYVCWTLLRLIKHFMLTWHFLQGVASCDTFLAEAFSWLSRCCKWTLGQKLSGKVSLLASQFAWHAAKTLPVSCQDFWTWSWSYHDHPFQTLSRIFIWQGRSDIKNGWGFLFAVCATCW